MLNKMTKSESLFPELDRRDVYDFLMKSGGGEENCIPFVLTEFMRRNGVISLTAEMRKDDQMFVLIKTTTAAKVIIDKKEDKK